MWLLLFLLLFILCMLILYYIYSKLVYKETYRFDKYEKFKYYKECQYDKRQCYKKLDQLRKHRTEQPQYTDREYPCVNSHFSQSSLIGKPQNLQKQNKEICIVTVSIGNRKFSEITKKRMEKYCSLYNYDFKYFTETLDETYPVIWQKCIAMNNVLNMKNDLGLPLYKIVVWFDDDIYITNFKYRIEDFLQLNPKKDIFMARDIIKNNYNHYINSGNYIMKNTSLSRDFMKDTLQGINLFGGYFRTAINHEQSINTYLYFSKKKYAKGIEVLPYGVLQSIYNKSYYWYNKFYWILGYFLDLNGPWEDGDFCIHFITMKENQRNEICRHIEKYDETIFNSNIAYPQHYSKIKKSWLKTTLS
jgi:hypothetical protein